MVVAGDGLDFGPSITRGYKQAPLDEQTIAKHYRIEERDVRDLPDEKVYSAILEIKEETEREGKELIQQFGDKRLERISEDAGVPVRYIRVVSFETGESFKIQYKIRH